MSYDSSVLALSPKHFWKMDETSGTVCTDYGSTPVNGVYNGSPTLNQSPLSAPSGAGSLSSGPTVSLDGVDDSMEVATNPAYTALTVCMWVKNAGTADRYWFEFAWASGSSLPIAIGGAGDFASSSGWAAGCFNGSGWHGVAGSSLSPAGQERLIIVTCASGGSLRLWENGKFKGATSVSAWSAYSAGLGLRVGRRWDGGGGSFSQGRVGGVGMWDRVLTDSEILSIIPPIQYTEQTNLLEPLAPNASPWRPYGETAAGGGGGGGGGGIPTTGQLWPRGNW